MNVVAVSDLIRYLMSMPAWYLLSATALISHSGLSSGASKASSVR
jgi:hypothetical protein